MALPYSHYTSLYIPFSGTHGDSSAAVSVPLGLTATSCTLQGVVQTHFSHSVCGPTLPTLSLPVSGSYSYFPVGTGDFTIEFFYNPYPIGDYVQIFQAGSLTIAYDVGIKVTAPGYSLYSSITTPTNSFRYVTVSRTSGVLRLWVNGVYIGNHADTTNYSTQYPTISTYNTSSGNNAFLSELRLTSGSNRGFGSNSNITVPTATFGESFYNTGSPGYTFGRGGLTYSLIGGVVKNIPVGATSSFTTLSSYVVQAGNEFIERMRLSPTLVYSGIMNTIISDYFVGIGAFDQSGNLNEENNEYISLSDLVYVLYPILVSETINFQTALSSLYIKVEGIWETIRSNSSASTIGTFYNRLVELAKLLDTLAFFKRNDVSENISVISSINNIWSLVNKVNNEIGITSSTTARNIVLIPLSENIVSTDTPTSLASFNSSIKDGFIFSLNNPKGQDTYLAYLLSPETMYVSNYNNYNFDGCAKYKGDYYFYNSSGLYKYGTQFDNGQSVRAEVETIAFNFHSSNLKQVPAIYLGWTSTGATYLKVKTDGRLETIYKLNKKTGNLHTQKIGLGKGLISRYFQFELVSNADDFSIESIDFYPVELRRKL